MTRPTLEVADILRGQGDRFLDREATDKAQEDRERVLDRAFKYTKASLEEVNKLRESLQEKTHPRNSGAAI
jgi:hypothetical protein